MIKNSDVLQWSGALNQFEIVSGSSLTQSFSDQRYWQVNAPNMRWVDRDYVSGAIVYSLKYNAWFTSTQRINPGTPEPGSDAAAAIWRKINSTYGSTVFFGSGDYDSSDTTAANNWGMPTGTYPSGQQPINGDSYYDILTGSITDFTVTQNAPKYTIDIVYVQSVGDNGTVTQAEIETWPAGKALLPYGEYYYFANGTGAAITINGGPFDGYVINDGDAMVLVSSGDPDADNDGWAATDQHSKTVTIGTPNPQSVPDTIVAHTSYGFASNFDITLPATVGEDTILAVLAGIQEKSQILRFEIRGDEDDAAIQEFEVLVSGQHIVMSQIAFIKNNSYIKEIQAKERAVGNIILAVKFTAAAANKVMHLRVESADGHLDTINTPLDTATFDASTPTLNGLRDYPDPSAQQAELIATSEDADIQVPQFFTRSSVRTNVAQDAFSLAVPPKRYLRATFLCQPNGTGSWPQIIGQRNGSWIDWSLHVQQGNQYWNDNGTYANVPNVSDIAKDNSGLYFWHEAPEAGKFLRTTVEMAFLKGHTTIHIHCNSIKGGGVRNYDCVVHYGERWDDFNFVGFKIGSTTFSFIEAYIQWE
jgi:hypothetical protein